MREAAGILEVFGCVAAFVAADAAAKAANVRIESIDKKQTCQCGLVACTAHHMPENQRQCCRCGSGYGGRSGSSRSPDRCDYKTYYSSTGRRHRKDAAHQCNLRNVRFTAGRK